MAYEVEWTKAVLQSLDAIVCYLDCEWSQATSDKFVEELLKRVNVLTKQPFMGMTSKRDKSLRSIKFSKHNLLYYRIEGEKLILLNIFDLRKHPVKNIYG